jgi:hypothetical protein
MQENEIYRKVEERPFIHACDLEEKLRCYIDVATFRNADRSLRTEVDFEVPANEIKFFGEGDDRGAAVEFRVLVRDSTMRKIASGSPPPAHARFRCSSPARSRFI